MPAASLVSRSTGSCLSSPRAMSHVLALVLALAAPVPPEVGWPCDDATPEGDFGLAIVVETEARAFRAGVPYTFTYYLVNRSDSTQTVGHGLPMIHWAIARGRTLVYPAPDALVETSAIGMTSTLSPGGTEG